MITAVVLGTTKRQHVRKLMPWMSSSPMNSIVVCRRLNNRIQRRQRANRVDERMHTYWNASSRASLVHHSIPSSVYSRSSPSSCRMLHYMYPQVKLEKRVRPTKRNNDGNDTKRVERLRSKTRDLLDSIPMGMYTIKNFKDAQHKLSSYKSREYSATNTKPICVQLAWNLYIRVVYEVSMLQQQQINSTSASISRQEQSTTSSQDPIDFLQSNNEMIQPTITTTTNCTFQSTMTENNESAAVQSSSSISFTDFMKASDVEEPVRKNTVATLDTITRTSTNGGSTLTSHATTNNDVHVDFLQFMKTLDFVQQDGAVLEKDDNRGNGHVTRSTEEIEKICSKNKKWFAKVQTPKYYAPLLINWKSACMKQQHRETSYILTPKNMVDILGQLSCLSTDFTYTVHAIEILADVLRHQTASSAHMPLLLEELVDSTIEKSAYSSNSNDNTTNDFNNNKFCEPSTYLYNMMLLSWTNSGLQNAEESIRQIVQRMETTNVALDVISYRHILRYYSGVGNTKQTERYMDAMKENDIALDVECLGHVLLGYSSSDVAVAQKYLFEMIDICQRTDRLPVKTITKSIQLIMKGYQQQITDVVENEETSSKEKQQNDVLWNATHFSTAIDSKKLLDSHIMSSHLLDMYVLFGSHGKYTDIAPVIQRTNLDDIGLTLMIKKYGKLSMAGRVTALVRHIVSNNLVLVDIVVFNTLVNAWADSNEPNTFDQALSVVRYMEEDLRCVKAGISPDCVTFSSVLKCLANSATVKKTPDAGKLAYDLIDEMLRRATGDIETKPNAIAYTAAIRACFACDDIVRAEQLLKQMRDSDIPPNRQTYTNILMYWSKKGSVEGAKRSQQTLSEMMLLSRQHRNKDIRPDTVAFNAVLSAWVESGSHETTTRLLNIYKHMLRSRIHPTGVTFNIIIPYLVKNESKEGLEAGFGLLKEATRSRGASRSFSPTNQKYAELEISHHVVLILKGWVNLGEIDAAAKTLLWWVHYHESRFQSENIAKSFYKTIVKAFIDIDQIQEATDFLLKIHRIFDINRQRSNPYPAIYDILCSAWSESDRSNKEEH